VLFRLSLFTVIEMCTILESSNIGTVFIFYQYLILMYRLL